MLPMDERPRGPGQPLLLAAAALLPFEARTRS